MVSKKKKLLYYSSAGVTPVIPPIYARATGQGTTDGSSDANAIAFNNIIQALLPPGQIIYLSGTFNQTLTITCSGTLGLSSNNIFFVSNDADPCIVNSQDTRNSGIDITSQSYITLTGITSIDAVVNCLLINGSTNITTNNCTFTGSGNQGIQHLLTSSATHNNPTCSNNTDDGISSHENGTVYIYGGTYENNSQAINFINTSTFYVYNAYNFSNNTVDIEVGTGTVTADRATLNAYNCRVRNVKTTASGIVNFFDSEIRYSTGVSDQLGQMNFTRCQINGSGAADHLFDFQSGSSFSFKYCQFINIPSGFIGMVLRAGVTDLGTHNLVFYGGANVGTGIQSLITTTLYNIVFKNMASGIVRTGGTLTLENCCFHGNTTAKTGTITSNNEVTGDPNFIDAENGNFNLGVGSSCLGTGETRSDGTAIDSANFSANPPSVTTGSQGVNWNIGAYV
jgi:hypothetical protein